MLRSHLAVATFSGAILTAAVPVNAQFSFAPPVSYNVGGVPQSIATADLNRDGLPDVIVATPTGVHTLMNHGDGTLAPSTLAPTSGISVSKVTTGDFDGDGAPDVAFGGLGPFVGVLLNRGDGTFRSIQVFGPGIDNFWATALVTGDFYRSGRTDLAVVNVGFFGCCATLTVFRNRGDGTFVSAASIALPEGGNSAAAIDVNGDGFSDLVTGNNNTNGKKTLSVFINSNGSFAAPAIYPTSGSRDVDGADLNHDGHVDLILSGGDASWIAVMFNNGDGSFAPATLYTTGPYPTEAGVADFDGDGEADVAVGVSGTSPWPLVVLRGGGDGSFEFPKTIAAFPSPNGSVLLAEDIDLNGAVDLIYSGDAALASGFRVIINQRLPPVDHGLRLSTYRGGNAGSVTLTIFGTALPEGSTAKLVCPGQQDISGANVVVSPTGFTIIATFNLVDVSPGQCTVVVTRPDGTTKNAAKPFAIEEGGRPKLWVDIVGFDRIRPGRPQTFYITYGNSGTVDASGVPIWVAGIPPEVTAVLGIDLADPERLSNAEPLDWADISPFAVVKNEMRLPLFGNKIPVGASRVIPLRLTCPPNTTEFEIRTWVTAPFFQSPLRPSVSKCLERVAILVASTLADVLPVPGLRNSACQQALGSELLRLLPVFYESWRDRHQSLTVVTFEAMSHQFAELTWRLIALIATDRRCAFQASDLSALLERTAFRKIAPIIIDSFIFGLDAALVYADCAQDFDDEHRRQLPVLPVESADPNDKFGPRGAGEGRHVRGDEPLSYVIFFENKDTATASAQEVVITDQLDISRLDLATLSLGPIGFGEEIVTPEPMQTGFTTTIDLRPSDNLIVRVNANLNVSTGLLLWKLEALDAITGLPPEDPTAGFLAPGVGGSVLFTVRPKQGLPTGTLVSNQASIVFDVNAPILTQVWRNALDNSPSTSKVLPLPPTTNSPAFEVNWAGTDLGSGIQDFTVYVSDDGGPFVAFKTNTSATSAAFNGQTGHTYEFYSVARDRVGNVEASKATGEATTTVVPATCAIDMTSAVSVTRGGLQFNRTTKRYVQQLTVHNAGTTTIAGPVAVVLDNLTNTTLWNALGSTNCVLPSGSPLIELPVGSDGVLRPGERTTVVLQFHNPSNGAISYQMRVVAGSNR